MESELTTHNTKKSKPFLIAGLIALLLILGLFVFKSLNNTNENTKTSSEADTKIIDLSEIATHNSKDSCWTAIDGGVYDITNFISKHEGGDRILAVCGINGSDLFSGKNPMGRAHNQMAKTLLSKMKIGKLQ